MSFFSVRFYAVCLCVVLQVLQPRVSADKADIKCYADPTGLNRMTLTMLGIKPVLLHTYAREGFLPSTERCAALITEKTKAIVLVSPNNPVSAPRPILRQKHA